MALRGKYVSNEAKLHMIRVTSYENRNPEGFIWNACSDKKYAFGNMTELMMLIEQRLDELTYPKAAVEIRSFVRGGRKEHQQPSADDGRPSLATFGLRVAFRHNASWQGSLLWQETGKAADFVSELELISLIDRALSGGEESKDD